LYKKTFSVILSNFNGSKFLECSIQSVLDQTFEDFEFIIIDDGSTDNSVEIINGFHQQFPEKITTPVLLKKNLGQANGFNEGIKRANGRFVSFIDSDDFWFPEKLMHVLENFGNEQRNAFHQHNLYFHRGNQLTNIAFSDFLVSGNYGAFSEKIREIPLFVATSGLTFRNDILKKVFPVPLEFKTCADGYLTRCALALGEVASTNYFAGAYREHESNATYGNKDHNQSKYRNEILLPHLFNFYKKNNVPWRFGHATSNEYQENLKNLHITANSKILILRCARTDLIEQIIISIRQKSETSGVDLLVQKSSIEDFKDKNLKILEIKDGPISKDSFSITTKEFIFSQRYELLVIPLSTWEIDAYGEIISIALGLKIESVFLIYPNGLLQQLGETSKTSD